MKKSAADRMEVLNFVRQKQPDRIHFLGMGYERRQARRLVHALLSIRAHLKVSMDSNRIRAVTGRGRRMSNVEAMLRAEDTGSLYGAVECEAFSLAKIALDYTDSIAMLSQWASDQQLMRIATSLGLSSCETRVFRDDPDQFLQSPLDEVDGARYIELPHVAHVLDAAWHEYVEITKASAIRTAAIHATFRENARTSHDDPVTDSTDAATPGGARSVRRIGSAA